MSADIVNQIKDAERQAQTIVQNSIAQASEIVKEAEAEKQGRQAAALLKAKEEGRAEMDRAADMVEKDISLRMQKNAQECADMKLKARSKKEKAIEFIIENIVS